MPIECTLAIDTNGYIVATKAICQIYSFWKFVWFWPNIHLKLARLSPQGRVANMIFVPQEAKVLPHALPVEQGTYTVQNSKNCSVTSLYALLFDHCIWRMHATLGKYGIYEKIWWLALLERALPLSPCSPCTKVLSAARMGCPCKPTRLFWPEEGWFFSAWVAWSAQFETTTK